ncbi:reverse transcriptase [Cucumis melo var. makuwa]|uniref:Reverse transcriptase n=1 Tax=Cucumis melo var. makuwa TaxID=1194695 RepID=A0A5D3CA59_CUCMM|nr:reverse transcriptase [Cucumis melo var. makuwa]TYK08733.1 reverse transcriptase [Cucumis melo var. makuwa]
MKVVNYVTLPIVGLVRRTKIKLVGWKGPVDFVVVKTDDFDVVLRMEFLLEHQVIPMPSTKCLVQVLVDAKDDRHGIESSPEAKVPAKNAYRTTPSELAELRKQSKKLLVRRKYPLPVLTRLLDRSRGTKYFLKSDIRPRYCRAAFNGLKQATIEGPSFGVTDATKASNVEVKQFNCVLGEYLHQFVDGKKKKNWVQLLNVAQFGHSAQTNSLIMRSQFEIKGSGHSVLSSVTDGPYVGNNPQVHKVENEWEQMADITRVCLKELPGRWRRGWIKSDAPLSSSG